jgi:DNA-binding NtrC family response regulator
VQPLPALLRVLNATASPKTLRLTAVARVVGAGEGCDMVVDEATVSRQHAELCVVPEGVVVRDLGSRNGIFYLGQRVEKMVLALGSRLKLGTKAELCIEPDLEALEQAGEGNSYRGLVGASPASRKLFAMLARLEGSLVNVLIEGESGVGKELCVRALHEGSAVAGGPRVIVNCGAIARELILSELFGHKKGAFTGALEARVGAFEAADGGTLFLDEIGELPLDVQPALLRALESGEVQTVGDTATKRVKVRVIAATNRDLQEEVKAGRFREDLYYRLAVVRLTVPPLRDRPEDIAILAERFASDCGLGALPAEVITQLQRHTWPGNARELRNAVQAYVALGALPDTVREADSIDAALRRMIDPEQPYQELKDALFARFTRLYLQELLKKTGGNQSAAARLSGIERSYLGKLLAKHGLARE